MAYEFSKKCPFKIAPSNATYNLNDLIIRTSSFVFVAFEPKIY